MYMYGPTDVRRSRALASGVVFAVAALLYTNTLTGNDRGAFENNADVSATNPFAVVFNSDIWGTPHLDGNPHAPLLSQKTLVSLSFELDTTLWANQARFQPTNVILHATVSVLLLWSCIWMGLDMSVGTPCALLFAAHPVHTEAVATIPGRVELLTSVLYLLALLTYQKSLHPTTKHSLPYRPITISWEWFGTSAIFAYLATLCSPRALSIIGVCLMYDATLVCNIDVIAICAGWKRLKNTINTSHDYWTIRSHLPDWVPAFLKRVSALILSALVIMLLRALITIPMPSTIFETENPASFSTSLLTRFLTYSYLLACNAWILLCPTSLCFDWSMGSIPLVTSLFDARNLASLALVCTVSLLLLEALLGVFGRLSTELCSAETSPFLHQHSSAGHGGHCIDGSSTAVSNSGTDPIGRGDLMARAFKLVLRRHFIMFSLVLIALPFLPESNLLYPSRSVISERALYLPSMGSCLLVAIGLRSCSGWSCELSTTALPWVDRARTDICPPPRVLGVGGQVNKVAVRRQVDTLNWHFGMKPHVIGVLYLILFLYSTKTVIRNWEWSNTQEVVGAALRVNPQNARVLVAVGNVLAQQGNPTCEKFYRQALFLNPNHVMAWCNLGIVQLNTGQTLEAEGSFLRALALNPSHIGANTNMAHLCRLQERWSEAKEHYKKAILRRPKDGELHYYMGFVSERLGTRSGFKDAERHYRLSINCQPDRQDAHAALANVLSASVIDGSDDGLSRRKRIEEAFAHYRTALRLNPEDLETRFALGKLLLASDALEEAKVELLVVTKLSPALAPAAQLQLNLLYSQLEEQAPPPIPSHPGVVPVYGTKGV